MQEVREMGLRSFPMLTTGWRFGLAVADLGGRFEGFDQPPKSKQLKLKTCKNTK